ncbi:MAG TPA: penicillin acylase family protein [Chitinophagaceae bacterium]|nr:penicillin acylase family protein [Chitinophagaceae bacterium]
MWKRKILLLLWLLPLQSIAQEFSGAEISRWKSQAKNVTIIRDNYGIPHIYGKSDADAVFGLLYAQCEYDFKRVEMNYVEKLGRMSEIKGESSFYDDLLIKMIIDTADAIADYKKSPAWLKKLMDAYADGINYYLYTHPNTKPALLSRFQPWYPLLWTDGSIGAINTAGLGANDLKNLYGGNETIVAQQKTAIEDEEEVLTGSNGFAFAPSITASHHSILYINPHVTFYFRPEVHVVSQDGLNVYGAVTWGQFFVYQGFNEHCGWMHTSSAVDAADAYIEKISNKNGRMIYEYNKLEVPITRKNITIWFKKGNALQSKTITVFYTHHGPVMAKKDGQWLSVRADNRIMNGLVQCWQRNKSKSFSDYKKTLDLKGNISNNTVYADDEGHIAYWHGNRIPIRDAKYDWSKPVDGSIKATEWKGLHTIDQTVHLYNPKNGWLQNCNSTPYTVAGVNSPNKKDYPAYMAPDGENFRGVNAVRVLSEGSDYTIDKVIEAGYDRRLSAFELLVPALVNARDNVHTKTNYSFLDDAVDVLKAWDYRCDENSVATTLAITWGEKMLRAINRMTPADYEENDIVSKTKKYIATAAADELLKALAEATAELTTNFGTWRVPWGDINRFQRISSDIDQQYKDDQPSIPVGFASSQWGMIPSYASRTYPGTKKRYGANGNSFICVVEFGKKIKAKSLLAGGESGDPNSKHFNDQALMYSKGEFKDVLFYKDDVLKHAERTYHPGE